MKLEQILKWVVVIGLFLVPITPLIVADPLFFPFITGKAFFFRTIIEIVFAAWLILVFLDKKYLPKKSPLLISVLAFPAIIFLANIFGPDFYTSFWSSFERMEGFVTLLHLTAFFVVIVSSFDKKLWQNFFLFSLGVSFIICFYSLLQLTGAVKINQGGVRVDATLGNAIYLAVYLLFHVFISIFYFFDSKKSLRYIYLALAFFQLIILYFTTTRGVVLGLIGGVLITCILILFFGKEEKFIKKSAGAVLLLTALLIGGFLAIKNTEFVRSNSVLGRFSEISLEGIKTQGRYFIWPMALEGTKESPILGYGQEGFRFVFSKHYNPALFNQEPWFDRVHNIYLDWLVAGGILGLLAFLGIFFFLIRTLWRSSDFSNVQKSILTGLVAAYLLQGIFVFDNLTSYILFFSILAFITPKRQVEKESTRLISVLDEKKIKNIVMPAAALLSIVVLYFVNVRPLMANRTLILAIQNQSSVEESLEYFKKVFKLNTFGNTEAAFQLFNRTVGILRAPTIPQSIKDEYFLLAKTQIEDQTKRFPDDLRIIMSTSSFYISADLPNEALKYLETAKNLSPNRSEIYLAMGAAYFSLGETEKAIENFNYAINLEPRNPEGHIQAALTLLYAGRLEDAETFLQKLGENTLYFEDRILNAFVASKQYERVLEIWLKRVETSPENLKNRQALVGTYLILGNWNQAIAELRKIIELDPTFKENGEYAIKEIQAGRGKNLVGQ